MVSPMGKFSAVFFDLDGVLIDSCSYWFNLFNDALVHFRRPRLSMAAFKHDAWGVSTKINQPRFFPDVPFTDLKDYYLNHFHEYIELINLEPEALRVLRNLKERGFKTALITNSHDYMIPKILDVSGLSSLFDVVKCFKEGLEPKPSPMMIQQAMDQLGLKPTEVIFVGDTNTDIIAGKRARVFTVGLGIMGDRKIDKLGQILEIVGEKA